MVREAVNSGAAFLPGVSASLLPTSESPGNRTIRLREAGRVQTIQSQVVLAASGLANRFEEHAAGESDDSIAARYWQRDSRVGAGVMACNPIAGYEPGVIYMACARDGYVGQVLVEDGRMDVAAALDPAAVKSAGGTGQLAERILKEAGFPVIPGLGRLSWKGTPHLTRQAACLGGERLFVLGDAAGYIEPFTGEGMAWALAGASRVAPLAKQVCRSGWDPVLLARWTAIYRRSVVRRQFVCRLTADLLRRRITTNLMVRSLSLLPWIARPFLQFMYRE